MHIEATTLDKTCQGTGGAGRQEISATSVCITTLNLAQAEANDSTDPQDSDRHGALVL